MTQRFKTGDRVNIKFNNRILTGEITHMHTKTQKGSLNNYKIVVKLDEGGYLYALEDKSFSRPLEKLFKEDI